VRARARPRPCDVQHVEPRNEPPDVHPTGSRPQREPGIFSAKAPMAGYPKAYNIEMDPHENLVVAGLFGWVSGSALKAVEEYLETLKKYPNPPAPNITQFRSGGG